MLKWSLQPRCLQYSACPCVRAYHGTLRQGRGLSTLAIETSCDDTSVAILETFPAIDSSPISKQAHLHFHQKITADNSAHHGIHPSVAHISHQENLATLINKAIPHLPGHGHNLLNGLPTKPDFVAVTRGPGMMSSLNTGINTAKGLAVAWQIPLLGVNHMQAHALTPRLVSALNTPAYTTIAQQQSPIEPRPDFPFLTLLVSGGHTLLVHSRSLNDHAILASTTDIAIGDCIDKMARTILPPELLRSSGEIMYGRLLERFAFPNGPQDHNYLVPTTRAAEIGRRATKWGWSLPVPLSDVPKTRSAEFSFTGLGSHVHRIHLANPTMSIDERRDLAREAMRVAFEHLAMRTAWALHDLQQHHQHQQEAQKEKKKKKITTLVISGGVASNGFLRAVLRSWLDGKDFAQVEINAPPIALCTDNAAMIAWCGVEMWRAGWASELGMQPLRKWSVDPGVEGGILGVVGWRRRGGEEAGVEDRGGESEGGGKSLVGVK